MNTLTIETEVTQSDIEVEKLITSSTTPSYFFVNAQFVVNIKVNDKMYEVVLQSGQSYIANDYSLPSNSLSVHDNDYGLFNQLDQYCESDLDDDYLINEINEDCDEEYTNTEILQLYMSLRELTQELEAEVNEADDEALEALEADQKIYVMVTEREKAEVYESECELRQCSENYIEVFNNIEDAEMFIEEHEVNIYDYARIVYKETGIQSLQER